VSNSLNKLVAYLLAHDYDVLVLAPTLPRGGSAREHVGDLLPTPSYGLPFRPEYRAAFMDACTELRIAEFAPDLVHIATPDKLGFDVQRWAAKRSLPVVCSYHTRFPAYIEYYMSLLHEPVEQALWAWLKFFYGNCLQTYPPSTSTLEELKRNGFGGDIRLWPRGIDLKAFNPRYRSTALRAEWGASSRTSVILLVCRMVAEKNLALFVRVIAALRSTALDFKVVIAGDGPLLGWMRKRLPEAVFMGTMVKEDLARVYASADVFFFPSKTETLGSVTLEAMASGTAVLAGNTTGSSDIVTHMRTGLLVDPDDFEGWVRAMIGLINDPPLRRRLADGALAALAASTDTTWDRSFHMLTGYYDEVLRGQHAQQHQQADPSEN
jgi:phosphatidylinositol alpha 1,6-mannosyltransferase